MAMVFAFGFYTRRRSLATWIFGVMLLAYTAGVVLSVWQETGGSRQIDGMGISQELGSMEGKEIRIGSAASAMWGMTTTVTSNGSVNSMHDSQTPLSGMLQMLNMQINCWFGGVGVGWMNYFAFLIIAVFISGLMVGRTPEFLGKKIEAREVRWSMVGVLLPGIAVLAMSGLAAATEVGRESICNAGPHGLTEILYCFGSQAGNNGSAFAGLSVGDTPFYSLLGGLAMLLARFGAIIPVMIIAGSMVSKKTAPPAQGTMATDNLMFMILLVAVVLIVGALTFFPALALGPILEHLLLYSGSVL